MDDNKKDTILEQWQTCVEMANAVSQRRDTMNNLFVTINLAMIAAFSVVWDIKSVMISVAGIIICIIWLITINNFKQLNSAKFAVINKLEEKLSAKPFTDEWDILQKITKYRDSTKVERVLPIMFIILYVVGGIIICYIKLKGEV